MMIEKVWGSFNAFKFEALLTVNTSGIDRIAMFIREENLREVVK